MSTILYESIDIDPKATIQPSGGLQSNLDLAERIHELLDDISLGVSQENMSADDIVEYIEEYIEHELELLIFKLENEIK